MEQTYSNNDDAELSLKWDNYRKVMSFILMDSDTNVEFFISEKSIKDMRSFFSSCINKDENDRDIAMWEAREQHMRDNPEKYNSPPSNWEEYRDEEYGKPVPPDATWTEFGRKYGPFVEGDGGGD